VCQMGFTNSQVFARKFIHIIGHITKEDIENEVRIIFELCRPGQSKTVVEVTKHGWLPKTTLYFIDMEYCTKTLEDHICGANKHVEGINAKAWSDTRDLFAISRNGEPKAESVIENIKKGEKNRTPNVDSDSASSEEDLIDFDFESVADILDNIISGLTYIHGRNVVHGDLRPRNGIALVDFADAASSTLLWAG
jgi:hypothetical protein